MNDGIQVRERLYDRYGIEPDRVDLLAAEQLLGSLDGALDDEVIEAAVVAAAVNGESHFLRHREQFEWIERSWLPTVLARACPSLRVLSAACSTGEEPYSLAAILARRVPAATKLEILALDVSEQSLAAARVGHYGLWSMRGLAGEAHEWLEVEGQRVVVRDWIKQPVRFAIHNLLEPLRGFGRFDLVLCRNVLIYLHDEAIDRVWRNLAEILADDGALLIAPGDPHPRDEVGLFAGWEGEVCVFTKRPSATPAAAPPRVQARPSRSRPARSSTSRPSAARAPRERLAARLVSPAPATFSPQPAHDVDARRATILRLVQAGELALARDLLVRLTAEVPLHVPSHILLALVAAELDELELYAEHARKAGFLEPDEPYPVFVMASALDRMGHRGQAERRYRWAAELLAEIEDKTTPLRYGDGLRAGQLEEILDGRS